MCSEIKKVIKETNVNKNKMSYAESVKSKTMLPELTKTVPLIIKPKEKQGIDKTKEELNKKVDPVNLKITSIENRKNGTLVIQTENQEEREKIKEAIKEKMSEDYEIKVPNPVEMSVTITDMSFKYKDNELVEKIKNQNLILKDSELNIIKTYEFKRNKRTIYNAKIKIDKESYAKIIEAHKINIGWEKCRVFDGTELMQCFKCQGFNHRANECRSQESCLKCHANHRTKDCKIQMIEKCINCIRANNKLNMGLDENHNTLSRECPVYLNKLNIKKRNMGLSI